MRWFTSIAVLLTMGVNSLSGQNLVPNSGFEKVDSCDFDLSMLAEGWLPEIANPEWEGKLDRGYINSKRKFSRIFIKKKGS